MINPDIKVHLHRDPFAIILEDVFDKDTLASIFTEIIANKSNFSDALIVQNGASVINKNFRSNHTAFFDQIYADDRTKSILLTETTKLIASDIVINLLNSAPYPFSNYAMTDTHETQVSRYGDTNEKYDWHIDRIGNDPSRIITISMYMYKEPQRFSGGEIVLSNGVLSNGKIYGETNRLTYKPKNNSCVIFNSRTPHCVMPTTSPEVFEDGRFSIQLWIGKRPINEYLIQQAVSELIKCIKSGLS